MDDGHAPQYSRAPEPGDLIRLCRALSVLADNAAADVSETDIREFEVVRVADEILVDLMGRACGLSYTDVAEDAESLDLDGVPVAVASPAALIRTKQTRRPQDAIDCAFLEGVIRDRAAGR